MNEFWRVYGGAVLPRDFRSESAARRLQKKYTRLGVQSSLYSGDGENWELCQRLDAGGNEYRLPGEEAAGSND